MFVQIADDSLRRWNDGSPQDHHDQKCRTLAGVFSKSHDRQCENAGPHDRATQARADEGVRAHRPGRKQSDKQREGPKRSDRKEHANRLFIRIEEGGDQDKYAQYIDVQVLHIVSAQVVHEQDDSEGDQWNDYGQQFLYRGRHFEYRHRAGPATDHETTPIERDELRNVFFVEPAELRLFQQRAHIALHRHFHPDIHEDRDHAQHQLRVLHGAPALLVLRGCPHGVEEQAKYYDQ